MRYQRKSAIAYMFRNFWHLAPVGLLAALLLGIFCNTNPEILFVKAVAGGKINADNVIGAILQTVTVLRFGEYWWCVLIALFVFVLTESLLTMRISRHMWTGEMVSLPLKRAISVFPTMLLFGLCFVVFVELMNLIVAGVSFLLRGAGVITLVVVSLTLTYVFRALAMFVVGSLLFAFPIMFMENYSFNKALSYSARLMSEKRKFLWTIALLYPLVKICLTAASLLIDIAAVTAALFALFYLFCLMFLPSVTFTMYYDTVGGERRDISKVIFG